MAKIKVKNPVVELDGDEMTRIIWQMIKDKLILPYLDIDLNYFDLGIEHRDADRRPGHDRRRQRHQAVRRRRQVRHHHARRGARRRSSSLKKMWKSPNGTIRNILDGTIFREPIICKNVPRLVPGWTKPIVIGRHAFGDQYRATDFLVPGKGKLKITFTAEDGGAPIEHEVFDFAGRRRRAWRCTTSTTSIRGFARACFNYGLQRNYPVYLSTKNTILKVYDGRFKDIFQEVFDAEFAGRVRGDGSDLRAPPDRRHGRLRR